MFFSQQDYKKYNQPIHLPIQKLEKISPNNSSAEMGRVISPSLTWASLRDSDTNSKPAARLIKSKERSIEAKENSKHVRCRRLASIGI